MPKPATHRDLVDLIRRSRLVDGPRLDRFLAADGPAAGCPRRLLAGLVDGGLLTRFQADQLAAGRWRGFAHGPYRLLELLGAGGMGRVYLAVHAADGGRVALKLLHDGLTDDPTARGRFAREARAAAALSHPNIVRVIGFDTDARPPYLAMEFIDGVSLQAAVARTGTFDAGTAAHCGREVALGLQRASEAGLVHRDIKPANLLADRAGRVKILDLGIVRTDGGDGLTLAAGERQILGTADYLAPEQAVDSHRVDTRADVYALGATLYFLLAGHPPFPDGSPQSKVRRKLADDPPPVDRLRPDVPAGLAGVIGRMLARGPAARFQTPQQAADALAPFAAPAPSFPARLFTPGRRSTGDAAGTATPRSTPAADGSGAPVTAVLTADAPTGVPLDATPAVPIAGLPAPAPLPTRPPPAPAAAPTGLLPCVRPSRAKDCLALWLAVGGVLAALAAVVACVLCR